MKRRTQRTCAKEKRTIEGVPVSKYAAKGASFHYEGIDLRRVAIEAERLVRLNGRHFSRS